MKKLLNIFVAITSWYGFMDMNIIKIKNKKQGYGNLNHAAFTKVITGMKIPEMSHWKILMSQRKSY